MSWGNQRVNALLTNEAHVWGKHGVWIACNQKTGFSASYHAQLLLANMIPQTTMYF